MLIKFVAEAIDDPTLLFKCEEEPDNAPPAYKSLNADQKEVLSRRVMEEIVEEVALEIEDNFSVDAPGYRYPHTTVDFHGLDKSEGPAGFFLNLEFTVTPGANPEQLEDIRGHFDLMFSTVVDGDDGPATYRATKYIQAAIYDFDTKQVTVRMKTRFPVAGTYDLEVWGQHFAAFSQSAAFKAVEA